MIVSAHGIEDVEAARKEVARISGVIEAEYNSVTRKLHVRYEGDATALRKIELEIKDALRGHDPEGKRGKTGPRSPAGRGSAPGAAARKGEA